MRCLFPILLGVVTASAAPQPAGTLLSPKERAQGYSDRVVLAKARDDMLASISLLEIRDGIHLREILPHVGGIRIIEVDAQESVEAMIARLQASGRYEFVEPDYLSRNHAVPNDPDFGTQWSLNNIGQTNGTVGADIGATGAWDTLHDATNVIVAVIDSGIRVDHPDLAPNLWVNPAPTYGDLHGARFIRSQNTGDITDNFGHGTRVASIIGAVGNNGLSMAGVAWRVQLMILKNSDDEAGNSTNSDNAACLNYAVAHGASIVNCSFGGEGFSQVMLTAIQAARTAGVIVVASAGNDSTNLDTTPSYPANFLSDNVVGVGNSTASDQASTTSNFGARVDLFAPGSLVPSLVHTSTSQVNVASGTSFSAPHVAGALALLRAKFPTDTYRQLINRLLRTVDVKTALAGKALTNGRLNLRAALASTSNRPFNDDFSTRAIVAGNTIVARANNTDATVEPGEPAHGAIPVSNTLWWQWVAISNGTVVVDTIGSAVDTTLAIFTGSSLNALTPVAMDDDGGSNQTSRIVFTAVAGTSYSIAVSSKTTATGYTQFNISPGPTNDTFASATVLSGPSAKTSSRNNAATVEPGEPAILGLGPTATLWYKWTAPKNGRFQVSAFTQDFDALLAVYTGTSLANLSLVAASDDTGADPAAGLDNHDSRCTIDAVAGRTYYIQSDTKSATRGEVFITVTDSLWQFSTDSTLIYGSPAVGTDGTIYIGTPAPDRRLYAITPQGKYKWSYVTKGGMYTSSPAIGNNGLVFFGSADGSVTALTSAGTLYWTRKLASAVASHGIAIGPDGTLYTHALDGYLYALNPGDGSFKWYYYIGATTTYSGTIVGTDGTIYQGSDDKNLYALNANGTLKWKSSLGAVPWGTPALDANGNIYLTTYEESRLLSLDANGNRRWTYQGVTHANSIIGSPALSGDGATVYIGAADNALHAVDATTGVLRWRHTTPDFLWSSSPAIDRNGVIYVGCWDGKLYAINPNGTLNRTWDTAQPIRASPIISGTTLYLPGDDAKLYAFDIGAFVSAGPWPQFRNNSRATGRAGTNAPAVTTGPLSQQATAGANVTLTTEAVGDGPVSYQWQRNGTNVAGATAASLAINGVQPATTGIYSAQVSLGSSAATTPAAILGLNSTTKLVGTGTEFADIFHPGTGFTYDQILLGANAAAVKADPGQILRISFVDLSNDIVQVEFSGAGTLSLVLDAASGPALPANYNQATNYMKGHAGIVLAGADASTNLSVFSVGRANAANQALFKEDVTYDGFADIAFIAITSTDGKFGGLRAANASCFATKGITGIYAPGVEFTGPVFIGDIRAESDATPMLVIGSGSDTRITGGDLLQTNNRAVQVSGLAQLRFVAGSNSHGILFTAQANRGRLEQNGADVTTSVVVNPTP